MKEEHHQHLFLLAMLGICQKPFSVLLQETTTKQTASPQKYLGGKKENHSRKRILPHLNALHSRHQTRPRRVLPFSKELQYYVQLQTVLCRLFAFLCNFRDLLVWLASKPVCSGVVLLTIKAVQCSYSSSTLLE